MPCELCLAAVRGPEHEHVARLDCPQIASSRSGTTLVFKAHNHFIAIALSPEVVAQVASVGAEVDEIGALAANSEALKPIRSPIFDGDAMLARIDEVVFVKKLDRLLASLEAACPGSRNVIACILVDEVSTCKIKKVKKALRSIGKKSGTIDKASAAA